MTTMRESRKGEKTHLPKDSTEVWLGTQKPVAGGPKHKAPPEDTYEVWVEKRVVIGTGTPTKGKKPAEVSA
jgi:hypothetical protein